MCDGRALMAWPHPQHSELSCPAPVHILVSLSLCLPQSLLLHALVGHPEDCAFVSCSLSPQPLTLSLCPVGDSDPVLCSVPSQTLSPSGHVWTPPPVGSGGDSLLPTVPTEPCLPAPGPLKSRLSPVSLVPPCPSCLFILLCLTCLPSPSVSSDLVQCVLPCSPGAAAGMPPVSLPSLFFFFPFLRWGVGEGGGWTQGLTPPGHMATAESQPHFRLVLSTLSVLGLWLMTVFASLLKGPVWSSAVVSVTFFPWVPKAHGPIHLNPCLDLVGTLLSCVFLGP